MKKEEKPTHVLDAWQRELLQERMRNPGSWKGKGRVLRVKFGYNPNSSSIGSVVSILLWSAAFTAMAINIVSAMVSRRAGADHLLTADLEPAALPPEES